MEQMIPQKTLSKTSSTKVSPRNSASTKPRKPPPGRPPDVVLTTNPHGDTILSMPRNLKVAFPGGKGKRLFVWARKTFELHHGRLPREIVDRRPGAESPTQPLAWGVVPKSSTPPHQSAGPKVPDIGPQPQSDWLKEADRRVQRAVEYIGVVLKKLPDPLRAQARLALLQRLEKGTL